MSIGLSLGLTLGSQGGGVSVVMSGLTAGEADHNDTIAASMSDGSTILTYKWSSVSSGASDLGTSANPSSFTAFQGDTLYLEVTTAVDTYSTGAPIALVDLVMQVSTTTSTEDFDINCANTGTYSATVHWGDGSTSTITTYNDAGLTHEYAVAGTYKVVVVGALPRPYFAAATHKDKIVSIDNIGDCGYERITEAFSDLDGCLTIQAGNADFSGLTNTSLFGTFRRSALLTSIDLSNVIWPASITSLQSTFGTNPVLTEVLGNKELFDICAPTRADECFKGTNIVTGIDPSGMDITAFPETAPYDQSMFNFLDGGNSLDTATYDQVLINFAAQDHATGLIMDMQASVCTLGGPAEVARTALVVGDFKIEDAISTVPAQMSAPNGIVISDVEIQVDLAPDPFSDFPITSYDIRWSDDDEETWTEVIGHTDGASVTGLTAETEYKIQARAVSWEGDGAWSTSETKTTLTNPGNFSLENIGGEPVITADSGNISVTIASGDYAGTHTQDHLGATLTVTMVEAAPTWIVKPTISGGTTVGATQTILPGLIIYSGSDLGDQTWTWDRDGTPISGETAITHVIVEADQDTNLNVEETYGAYSLDSAATNIPAASGAPDAFVIGNWSIADGGDGTLDVTISALPADNGNSITDIEYTIDGGSQVSTGGTSTFAISSGLTDGQEVDIVIFAVNSQGTSPASDTKAETPTDVPDVFDEVDGFGVATGSGSAEVDIDIQELPFNGGSALTDILYTVDDGVTEYSLGSTETTVYPVTAGLTDNTSHDIRLIAKNANGNSADSTELTVTAGTASGYADPTDDANLISWWDASDSASVPGTGGNANGINDQEAAGNDFVNASGTKPHYDDGVLTHTASGLNIIRFDDATISQGLRKTAITDPATDYAVHMYVTLQNKDANDDCAMSVGEGGAATVDVEAGTGDWTGLFVNANGTDITSTDGPYSGDVMFSVVIDPVGETFRAYVNGVEQGSSTALGSSIGANFRIVIGASRANNQYAEIDFMEGVYTTSVDSTSITNYYNYFSGKWAA